MVCTEELVALLQDQSLLDVTLLGRNLASVADSQLIRDALIDNIWLKKLELSCNRLDSRSMPPICEGLIRNSTLQTLSLRANNLGEASTCAIAHALARNTSLQSIDVSSNNLGGPGARNIAMGLIANSSLNHINLRMNAILPDAGLALGAALVANRFLRTVDLSTNSLGDESTQAIASALFGNCMLESLDLSCNVIRDDGAQAIGRALARNTSLKILNLWGNRIEAGGARAIAEALKVNTSLQTLELSGNIHFEDGIHSFAEALALNIGLQVLGLHSCALQMDGIASLAQGLSRNSTLHTLDVHNNNVMEEGANFLAQALTTNSALHTLDLSSCVDQMDDTTFFDMLASNHVLRALDLSCISITDEAGEACAEYMTASTSLETLKLVYFNASSAAFLSIFRGAAASASLSHISLTSVCLEELSQIIRASTSLRVLELCEGYITEGHLNHFVDAMAHNTTLQELKLLVVRRDRSCPARNYARQLARMLTENSTLQSLELVQNALGHEGAKIIADALVRNMSLQSLDLSDNMVGNQGALALAAMLAKNRTLRTLRVTFGNPPLIYSTALEFAQALYVPRLTDLTLHCDYQLGTLGESMLLPAGASYWSNEQLMTHLRYKNMSKLIAFIMGLNARLGSASLVRGLGDDAVRMVSEAFFGLQLGALSKMVDKDNGVKEGRK